MGKRLTDEERARRAQKRRLARQRKRRAKPQKRPPEPKGKDRKKKAEGAGVQRTIEQYLKELEAREAKDTKQAQAIEKAADKARNFPTAENIEAVAELQDAAMLAEEQAQQAAIGAQRKAIEAGKAVKTQPKVEEQKAQKAEEAKEKKTANENKAKLKPKLELRQWIRNLFKRPSRLDEVYNGINIGDKSPWLQAADEEFNTRSSIKHKAELVDSVLDETIQIRSTWNGDVWKITRQMQKEYGKQKLVGAYLPEEQTLALRNNASMGTIIHELIHARTNEDKIYKSLNSQQRLIEDNIEDGLAEFITICIYKKMNKPV